MKQFWTFVSKEFVHILRDPLTLLILIGMPVMEMLIFGFALNMEVTNIRTVIIDHAHDNASQHIVQALRANPYFIYSGEVASPDAVEPLLRADQVDLAIVLPPDLDASIARRDHIQIQVITEAADSSTAQIRYAYTQGLIATSLGADASLLPYSIDINTRMLFNPSLRSAYNFVPGIMGLVLIIICTLMTSVSIAREKEKGSLELLLVSPVRPHVMVLAKTIPYLAVSAINITSILLLAKYVLDVPMRGPLWLVLLLTLVYVVLALAIGMLVSAIANNQAEAIMISGFSMMMPTIVFSGMLFPIANMPLILQWVTRIVPGSYYIDAVRKVMIQGLSISAVWPQLVILILMAALLLTLAILSIRPRLNR